MEDIEHPRAFIVGDKVWPSKAVRAEALLKKDFLSIGAETEPHLLAEVDVHRHDFGMALLPWIPKHDELNPIWVVGSDDNRFALPHAFICSSACNQHKRAGRGEPANDLLEAIDIPFAVERMLRFGAQ